MTAARTATDDDRPTSDRPRVAVSDPEALDVSGRLVATLHDYATYRLGPDGARDVLVPAAAKSRTPYEHAIDTRSWVSLDTFHDFADALRPHLGERVVRDALTWAIPVRRDFSAMSLSAITGPELMYRFLDRSRSYFAHHLHFEVARVGSGRYAVELKYREGVPRRRDSCDVGHGVLLGIPLLFDLPAAHVVEQACYAQGAEACRYDVRFENHRSFALLSLLGGAAVAALAALAVPTPFWLGLPLAAVVVGREVDQARQRARMARVTEDHRRLLEENEHEFLRRYRELAALNAELEERVAARTRELEHSLIGLAERNVAMKQTLEEMKRMQHGLVDEGVRRLSPTVQEFAHEIHNPMTTVLANLDYLETTVSQVDGDRVSSDEISEVVREARIGVQRMRGVLAWFIDLHDDASHKLAPYDIDREIKDTVALAARAASGRVAIHVDLGDAGVVEAYGKQLSQVFANLIANAAQAMESGNVWVETRGDADTVFVRVSDDGPGIPAGLVERIFERGFTTKPKGGSGLGLFISRAIVERHGGALRVDADPTRSGARFTVEIPRHAPRTNRGAKGAPPRG